MILYLIRHGEMKGDPHRHDKPPVRNCLSARGVRQAVSLARAFRGVRLDRIVASPLGRALQTAQALLRGRKLRIELAPWIVEWRPNPDLMKAESTQFERMMRRYGDLPVEQTWKTGAGESLLQMADRIIPGFQQMLRAEGICAARGGWLVSPRSRKRVLVLVAHGGSLNVLFQYLIGAPLRPGPCVAFEQTGVVTFRFAERAGVAYPELVISPPLKIR
ncbi:MAG: histidine phosphatase family protein [Verrucomicrobiia bacterium]|jgi:broad specificity phosphatase PhoE